MGDTAAAADIHTFDVTDISTYLRVRYVTSTAQQHRQQRGDPSQCLVQATVYLGRPATWWNVHCAAARKASSTFVRSVRDSSAEAAASGTWHLRQTLSTNVSRLLILWGGSTLNRLIVGSDGGSTWSIL
jgi:hypothetical protein